MTEAFKKFPRFNLQLFAEDPPADPPAEPPKTEEKVFTQAELDAQIAKIVARERKKAEDKIKEMEDKAKPPATPPAEPPKDGATPPAAPPAVDPTKEAEMLAKVELANKKVIDSLAKIEALKLGVEDKNIAYVVKLADLSSIEVKEGVDIDTTAINKLIAKVLEDLPALKKQEESSGGFSGFRLGGSGGQSNKESNQQSPRGATKSWNRQNHG